MRHQPVPQVTSDDVSRVVLRDFAEDEVPRAWALLDSWGGGPGPPNPRVALASLKMADGDLGRLQAALAVAKDDYRDVLAWAEYPEYMRSVPGPGRPPDVERVIEADWRQYQAWLTR